MEQRIEELKQLSVGQTAVDDVAGNRLFWTLGGLACQLLHLLRFRLSGAWRRALSKRLRAWLFGTPAKFTNHSEQWRVHLTEAEWSQGLLLRALAGLRPPPGCPPRGAGGSERGASRVHGRTGSPGSDHRVIEAQLGRE